MTALESIANEATAVDVVELTRPLVRFDSSNPPGNEAACITILAGLLADAGLDCHRGRRQSAVRTSSPGCPAAAPHRRCCCTAMWTWCR